jgi:hypothetical protein
MSLYYFTPDKPAFVKDFTVAWWNPSGRGKDEIGNDGVGFMMKADNGKRTEFFLWDASNPTVFADDPNPAAGSDHYPQPHFTGSAPPRGKRCLSCSS